MDVRRSILIVEDDEIFLRPLQRTLETAGYEVLTAATAEDAIDVLKADDADLVLTDRRLSGMDGLDLVRRLNLSREDDSSDDLDAMLASLAGMPGTIGDELRETWKATPPYGGRPVQFVDVFPKTADGKVHLCPPALDAEAPHGLYGYQPDPATDRYPLALISPASEKTISSTLGELRERPGMLQMHPSDAAARGLSTDDPVRVFNDLGEVECEASVTPEIRPGTVSLPKGLWARSTFNGSTSNALVPDTLTDIADGACFNDARVQVELLARH